MPLDGVLELQQRAGNRAVGHILARRVVGNDSATRVVKLAVGYELSEKALSRSRTPALNPPRMSAFPLRIKRCSVLP